MAEPHQGYGISESAILGLSCGAAVCGLKPVPEIMFRGLFRGFALNQLTNNAKLNFMYQERHTAV